MALRGWHCLPLHGDACPLTANYTAKVRMTWARGRSDCGREATHPWARTWRRANRRSLAEAILQAENGGAGGGPPFEWDIMLDIGDLSGSQTPPGDEEGEEVVRQYSVSTHHPREDFYNIVGNHDASGPGEPCQWWFRKWVDPTGENSEHSNVHDRKAAVSDRGDLGTVFVQGREYPVSRDGRPERRRAPGGSGRQRRVSGRRGDAGDVRMVARERGGESG